MNQSVTGSNPRDASASYYFLDIFSKLISTYFVVRAGYRRSSEGFAFISISDIAHNLLANLLILFNILSNGS